MIIKDNDRSIKTREAMRGGPGIVYIKDIVGKDNLYEKGRLYAQMCLKPGCGVGYHEHEGEEEIFVITKGTAIYSDDGREHEVGVGDVMICPDGHGHAITNRSDSDCEFTALIVYK